MTSLSKSVPPPPGGGIILEGGFRAAHGPLFFARPKKRGEKKGRPAEVGPDENAAGDSGIFIAFPRGSRPRGPAHGASLHRSPGRGVPSPRPASRALPCGRYALGTLHGDSKNQSITGEFFLLPPVARAEHWTEQGKPRRGRSHGWRASARGKGICRVRNSVAKEARREAAFRGPRSGRASLVTFGAPKVTRRPEAAERI